MVLRDQSSITLATFTGNYNKRGGSVSSCTNDHDYLVGNRNSRTAGNFLHIGDLKLKFLTSHGMTLSNAFDLR